MRSRVPVDLLRVSPRVFASFDIAQAASLAFGGVCALSSIVGAMPEPLGIALAAGGAAFAVGEVQGVPLRRLAIPLLRFVLRRIHEGRSPGDDPLWLFAPRSARRTRGRGPRTRAG